MQLKIHHIAVSWQNYQQRRCVDADGYEVPTHVQKNIVAAGFGRPALQQAAQAADKAHGRRPKARPASATLSLVGEGWPARRRPLVST